MGVTLGDAVHRRRRGEHEGRDARVEDALQQRERGDEVALEVPPRRGDGLAHLAERGEVQHGAHPVPRDEFAATDARSATSASRKGTSSGTASRCPVTRLSTTTGARPAARSRCTTWEPMYPAPPVTMTLTPTPPDACGHSFVREPILV
jgi:hypothetical protein